MTVKTEKKEEVTENATHHAGEWYYGQYCRSATLPYPVKENQESAIFGNGVLELRIPKSEEVKAKKIAINAQLPNGKKGKSKEK